MAPPMLPRPINPKRSNGTTVSPSRFILAPIAAVIPPAALLFPRVLYRWHILPRRYRDPPALYPHAARPLACRRWQPQRCRRESFCEEAESPCPRSRDVPVCDRQWTPDFPPSPCLLEERYL